MKLTRKEFEELVVSALKGLPKFFKKKMKNVDVVVEDRAPTISFRDGAPISLRIIRALPGRPFGPERVLLRECPSG